MYYITIRQRGKPRRRGENPMGFRDSDSLLHSLSSGLWGIRKHRRKTAGVFLQKKSPKWAIFIIVLLFH